MKSQPLVLQTILKHDPTSHLSTARASDSVTYSDIARIISLRIIIIILISYIFHQPAEKSISHHLTVNCLSIEAMKYEFMLRCSGLESTWPSRWNGKMSVIFRTRNTTWWWWVKTIAAYWQTYSCGQLAWSEEDSHLALFYVQQMNRVNSLNGSAVMTAPQTLSSLKLKQNLICDVG